MAVFALGVRGAWCLVFVLFANGLAVGKAYKTTDPQVFFGNINAPPVAVVSASWV